MIALHLGDHALEIALTGAEVRRWTWRGQDLLWSGDPVWWNRVSPLLFPIVGALRGGTFRHGGRTYALPKHGFARDLPWEVLARDDTSARLGLRDSDATRAVFPFAFDLQVHYALQAEGLHIQATLANPGDEVLPASFGLHPAFRWPLDPAFPKEAHRVRFDEPEPGPLRKLSGDLLAGFAPTPVEGRDLGLRDDLFREDALIWEAPRSRGLVYGAPGGLGLRLTWDLPHLGIWTRPGAPFLCLEPWQGLADPVDFQGDFLTKPGAALVAPREVRRWWCEFKVRPSSTPLR